MYNIKKEFKYRLVDRYNGTERVFKDKDSLINYFVACEKSDWIFMFDTCFKDRASHTINTVLDNIACNDNDLNADGTPKRYMLFASDGRILCGDMYRAEVIERYKAKTKEHRTYEYKPWWADKVKVEFRKDPIPHTGFKHRGNYYRRFKTTNEKRKSADVEYKQYVKPKRNFRNLPDTWDEEKVRHIDKCWKSQSKKKKQWM